jgi:hypothetical protein
MTDPDQDKAEEFLKGFSLKPAPPRLRAKILTRAVQERKAARVMTPLLWKTVLGCSILTLIFSGADKAISKSQQSRMDSLFKEPTVSRPDQRGPWPGDILNDVSLSEIIGRDQPILLFGRSLAKVRPDYKKMSSLAKGEEGHENEQNLY